MVIKVEVWLLCLGVNIYFFIFLAMITVYITGGFLFLCFVFGMRRTNVGFGGDGVIISSLSFGTGEVSFDIQFSLLILRC